MPCAYRRWRNFILVSPRRRLDLQLSCTPETPAKDTLEAWPAFTLVAGQDGLRVIGHRQHHCRAIAYVKSPCALRIGNWKEALAAMHVPFPELTNLRLFSDGETLPVTPAAVPADSFLGEFCPTSARHPFVWHIGFVCQSPCALQYFHSGYIAPEVIL